MTHLQILLAFCLTEGGVILWFCYRTYRTSKDRKLILTHARKVHRLISNALGEDPPPTIGDPPPTIGELESRPEQRDDSRT